MSAWYILDSYGCLLHRTASLSAAFDWLVPASHRSRTRPCSICDVADLGGGVHEVSNCDGIYTVTRHRPPTQEGS